MDNKHTHTHSPSSREVRAEGNVKKEHNFTHTTVQREWRPNRAQNSGNGPDHSDALHTIAYHISTNVAFSRVNEQATESMAIYLFRMHYCKYAHAPTIKRKLHGKRAREKESVGYFPLIAAA